MLTRRALKSARSSPSDRSAASSLAFNSAPFSSTPAVASLRLSCQLMSATPIPSAGRCPGRARHSRCRWHQRNRPAPRRQRTPRRPLGIVPSSPGPELLIKPPTRSVPRGVQRPSASRPPVTFPDPAESLSLPRSTSAPQETTRAPSLPLGQVLGGQGCPKGRIRGHEGSSGPLAHTDL
jgi:hypothetical protein